MAGKKGERSVHDASQEAEEGGEVVQVVEDACAREQGAAHPVVEEVAGAHGKDELLRGCEGADCNRKVVVNNNELRALLRDLHLRVDRADGNAFLADLVGGDGDADEGVEDGHDPVLHVEHVATNRFLL
jgi:hypothetical protein